MADAEQLSKLLYDERGGHYKAIAEEYELAVIHWMGGGYKVVGRYRADAAWEAREHADRCSANGYCPTSQTDNDGFLKALDDERSPAATHSLAPDSSLNFSNEAVSDAVQFNQPSLNKSE